ncbi:MAG: TOBE domain-containing protein, partial [Chitinophagaceae bacterium]
MIRPEHIEIIPILEAPQTGVIEEVLFCGDHHTVLVHMNHQVLRVKTNRIDISIGDHVGLHWAQA